MAGGYLQRHLPKIIALYKPKQEAMLHALDRYLPAGFTWTQPDGGMFIWVEGPAGLDGERLYWQAIERKVAFVPGKFFYVDREQGNATLRLNYTMADAETIDRAVYTLSEVMAEAIA